MSLISVLGLVLVILSVQISQCAAQLLELVSVRPSFETHHVFCGEFTCLNESAFGPHEFLRFELELFNNHPIEIHLETDERYIDAKLLDPADNSTIAEHLNIPLPFLRDSRCLDGHAPRLVAGSDFRISPTCYSTYEPKLSCFWIDVSNLTLPDTAILLLSFGNASIALQFQPVHCEHNRHISSTVGSAFVPVFFLAIFFTGYSRHRLSFRKTDTDTKLHNS